MRKNIKNNDAAIIQQGHKDQVVSEYGLLR